LIWALGLLIAAATVYLLTPFALRKVKLWEGTTEVHRWLEELAVKAGLKKTPKIKVFDTPEVNALAYCTVSGGVICLTRGLLDAYREGELSPAEFKAIMAHEIGHLKHQDLMKFNLALAWVGVFEFFGTEVTRVGVAMGDAAEGGEGWWAVMLMLTAWFALFLGSALLAIAKLASALSFHLSRRQELEADDLGGELTHPESMAAALEKIEQLNARLVAEELEKLPFSDRWQLRPRNRSWVERLWDAHPPTPSRVGRQRALAEFLGFLPE
jgi:heat shock protein HtpX